MWVPMVRLTRRRVRLALGAIAVLSLAGCVNMPSSGPPSSLPVNQTDAGQSQDYVGPFASGPGNDWSPQEIVQGFLFASASYYTDGGVVKQYLTPQAAKSWNPGGSVTVFRNWPVTSRPVPSSGHDQQTTVTVSGQVQATLNGSGQQLYASVAQGNSPSSQSTANGRSCAQARNCYSFTLVKSASQWRIANAPNYLLLDQSDFERAWEPQDLYFLDASKHVLVPDSVFVPLGTSETDLLNKLAAALLTGPAATWLAGSTVNVFPSHTSINVTPVGPTAIVNLKGKLTQSDQAALPYVAAELVWTLASVSQSPIQTVLLQVNGSQWGTAGAESPKTPAIAAYNPYPSEATSFSYVDGNGVAQSACGGTQNAPIGPRMPIFGPAGRGEVAGCAATAPTAPSTSSAQPKTSGKANRPAKPGKTYSMVAVSPDGKDMAAVSADGTQLSIGPVGDQEALKSVPLEKSMITSISWDRQHELWLTQGGVVYVVPLDTDKPTTADSDGNVTALSVAPDGVRVAMIVQDAAGSQLQMAAINPNGSLTEQPVPHGTQVGSPTLGTPVPLGPDITNPTALAWYDADNLVVVAKSGAGSELEEVPVDGRPASRQLAVVPTPPHVTVASIATGNTQNVVVVGLSNGQLEVSAGFEGPWQGVGPGYEPAYWIPPAS